jgi:predicted transcriptional regulator of viral defense system
MPGQLPATFSYSDARAAGLSKHALYRLRDTGRIEALHRGLYRRTDAPLADLDLLEAALRAPRATLCLTTALARHGLTDPIPDAIDLALPRRTRHPAFGPAVRWHSFDPETFDFGRTTLDLDGETAIGLYSPERCIIDAFRLRGHDGPEPAYEALRRWLRTPGAQPAQLLALAQHFSRTETPIRHALQILL